jgi:hypothetical protein
MNSRSVLKYRTCAMGLTSSSRDDTASLSPTHAADGSDRSIMLIFPSCKNGEKDKSGSRPRGHPAACPICQMAMHVAMPWMACPSHTSSDETLPKPEGFVSACPIIRSEALDAPSIRSTTYGVLSRSWCITLGYRVGEHHESDDEDLWMCAGLFFLR